MKDKDLNFEKALADLEQTVDKLEKGKLSLNESLALFEKGVKLARFLRDELDRAEKKIEILLKDEKGATRRAPFDLEGEDEGEGEEEKGEEEEAAEDGASKPDAGDAPAKKPAKKKPEDDDVLPF
jgi:exodeoxyribonuclease VII small subunit